MTFLNQNLKRKLLGEKSKGARTFRENVSPEGPFYIWSYSPCDAPKSQPPICGIAQWIQPAAAAAQCAQTVKRASPDAHACSQSHLHTGGDVEVNCSAQNTFSTPSTHFYFTFLPFPLLSSKNEGYRLALLRRTGHVPLRGSFFPLRVAAGVPVPRRLRAAHLEVHCCSGVISHVSTRE